MVQDVLLPNTQHDQQAAEYWCGPACVNIALTGLGETKRPQSDLWAAIQANTGATPRPADAELVNGSFPTQRCDSCGGTHTGSNGKTYGNYNCWFTTPEAMAATINGFSAAKVGAELIVGGAVALRRVLDGLDAKVPAVMTIKPALHWVVVIGYQIDGPNSNGSIVWNGKTITAFYVRDPAQGDPGQDTLQLVTLDGLRRTLGGLMMSIDCGPHQGAFPVVVASSSWLNAFIAMVVTILRGVTFWIDPRRFRRYLRRSPGRPPRPSGSFRYHR
jgi:hypothetical protein